MGPRYEDTVAADRLSRYVGVIATAWDGAFGRDAVRLVLGQDSDVLLLGTELVFRFPRHERALAALPREVAALDRLASHDVGALLPAVAVDHCDDALGLAFVGQRYLPGEPLPPSSVEAVGPLAYRYAAELARVLDALAGVPVDAGLAAVLATAPLGETWAALATGVRERLFPAMSEAGRARAETELAAVTALQPVATPSLVHGDFGGENLRWDADDTRLTGVLDWGQAHLGDPAYDVASIGATYGWDLAATVDATMAAEDRDRLGRARAYAATFALHEAWHGVTTGDEVALRRGLASYLQPD